MKNFVTIIFAIISSTSWGLDENPQAKILKFNIGGYEWDVSRSTIEQSGGHFLNTLVSKFSAKDTDQRIFIDQPREAGEIISCFIKTNSLPHKYDIAHANNAADFFGIPEIKTEVENRIKQKNIFKKWRGVDRWGLISSCSTHGDEGPCTIYCGYRNESFQRSILAGTTLCPECKSTTKLLTYICAAEHLLTDHGAKIIFSTHSKDRDWEIWYRPSR